MVTYKRAIWLHWSENHVVNNLKKILVYAYLDSIINNQTKNGEHLLNIYSLLSLQTLLSSEIWRH